MRSVEDVLGDPAGEPLDGRALAAERLEVGVREGDQLGVVDGLDDFERRLAGVEAEDLGRDHAGDREPARPLLAVVGHVVGAEGAPRQDAEVVADVALAEEEPAGRDAADAEPLGDGPPVVGGEGRERREGRVGEVGGWGGRHRAQSEVWGGEAGA